MTPQADSQTSSKVHHVTHKTGSVGMRRVVMPAKNEEVLERAEEKVQICEKSLKIHSILKDKSSMKTIKKKVSFKELVANEDDSKKKLSTKERTKKRVCKQVEMTKTGLDLDALPKKPSNDKNKQVTPRSTKLRNKKQTQIPKTEDANVEKKQDSDLTPTVPVVEECFIANHVYVQRGPVRFICNPYPLFFPDATPGI